MPVLRSADPFAGTRAPNHPNHLAIRGLGLDMVGPLKKGLGGFTHLLVAVDKFTKWIEAKPITNIHLEEAVKFFLDIIYRFSVPNYIITDHGTNFTGKKFLEFSNGYGIRIDWPRSDIHELMVRSNMPMTWSSKDLSHASLTDSTSTPGDGL